MRFRPGAGPALFLAVPLAAQAFTSGGLQGTVRAADGTPIPGARLTLQETRTNREVHLACGPDGAFRLLGIEPGPCTLRVAAEGYGTQRITGLRIRPGANTELPVELIPMEAGMVLDVEAPNAPTEAAGTALLSAFSETQLRALPLRERSLLALADLAPWPAPPARNLRVNGLDLGGAGADPAPIGIEGLSGVQIVAGGAPADQAETASLRAATRGGGNAFEGEGQALWSPGSWGTGPASDRLDTTLAASGPLRRDRLFYAVVADHRRDDGETASSRGSLRVDWLPDDTQQWTLGALGAQASGLQGAGRDQSISLAHRWTPRPDFVQAFQVQTRTVNAPGLGPARSWEAIDTLGLDLGTHGLRAGVDLRQVHSDTLPGAAWRQRGLYLQDDWRLAESFTLGLGLRHDQEDATLTGLGAPTPHHATSPRLAFSWQASARIRLYGGHGRYVDPSPLVFFQPLPPLPEAPPDRRESHLGLAFLPLPDLALTLEARDAEGRLQPGGSDQDRLQGLSLGGRWQVREILSLAASWTVAHTRTAGPLGPQDGTLRRLRLWAVWDTRELASPWARDWTLALVGRFQSGAETPAVPGLTQDPNGAALLDLRLARTLTGTRRLRIEALLDAFDLLDRTRPVAPLSMDAGRRVQLGLRAAF